MARGTYLQIVDLRILQSWGSEVMEMFRGEMPYLVGSALERPSFRDIDIRVLLEDKKYAKLKKLVNIQQLGLSVSLWGKRVTGLEIDFQIQQRTAGNEVYKKSRYPLVMPREEYDA